MRHFAVALLLGNAIASSLASDVDRAIGRFKRADPDIGTFFSRSVGYAVYPNVGKGGLIIGGAHGKGLVYQKGRLIGESKLTQGTIGAQIGGQAFSEVVFFETAEALGDFKRGQFTVGAQVSAVAVNKGKAKSAKYDHGVAVFILPKAGLMAEATVGGQKLTFKAK